MPQARACPHTCPPPARPQCDARLEPCASRPESGRAARRHGRQVPAGPGPKADSGWHDPPPHRDPAPHRFAPSHLPLLPPPPPASTPRRQRSAASAGARPARPQIGPSSEPESAERRSPPLPLAVAATRRAGWPLWAAGAGTRGDGGADATGRRSGVPVREEVGKGRSGGRAAQRHGASSIRGARHAPADPFDANIAIVRRFIGTRRVIRHCSGPARPPERRSRGPARPVQGAPRACTRGAVAAAAGCR